MENLELYPRKCAVSGDAMIEGWFINGGYYSEKSMADDIAKEFGFKNFKKMYVDGGDDYWSTWECDFDEDVFYTEDGKEVLKADLRKEFTGSDEDFKEWLIKQFAV